MDKLLSDFEKYGGTYTKVGDYYLPDLALPEDKIERPIGIWGIRHKKYLLEQRKTVIMEMQLSGTLMDYLADINEQAEEMFLRLVNDMAKAEDITEQLKVENQMMWVQMMNNIRNRALEIVSEELVYT